VFSRGSIFGLVCFDRCHESGSSPRLRCLGRTIGWGPDKLDIVVEALE
jgi:hypothetical protein